MNISIIKDFLPWILYSILAGSSQQQLTLAIVVAILTTITLDRHNLKKGFILSWGTLLFFSMTAIALVIFKSIWVEKHIWVLSNLALALIAWLSLLWKKPFTIQYAKQQVAQNLWQHPAFIKINYTITTVWAVSFSLSMSLNILQLYHATWNPLIYQITAYFFNIAPILFTLWYPKWHKNHVRVKLQRQTQKNPYLAGNFAPVHDELEVKNLTVIGEIPRDLNGVYMRNGPNPAFPPISYTYPFDGDGMIHAVYIENGRANYRNRFVETRELKKERLAGKALYGGILHPMPLPAKWRDSADEPFAIKNGAFVHIIRHANKYIALYESSSAYELTKELKTQGLWIPSQAPKPFEICPHPRLDPATGELWLINYSIFEAIINVYCVDANGLLTKNWRIEKSHSTMIHDFVLTQNYVVIFDCPAVFAMAKMLKGDSLLTWRPELGVRIGVISRNNGKVTWFQTDAFFVFHFANAYENNEEIIIDYVKHAEFSFLAAKQKIENNYSVFHQSRINLKTHTVRHVAHDERLVEFPRFNEQFSASAYQFAYMLAKTAELKNPRAMNALIKYDMNNNHHVMRDFGPETEISEAVFVAAQNAKSENEGYLMLFVYHHAANQSELCIIDANNISDKPLARIIMPRRVPHGLHGSWMPSLISSRIDF